MRKFTRLLIIVLISVLCFTPAVYGNGNNLYPDMEVDADGAAIITNDPICHGPWGQYRGGGGTGRATAYGYYSAHKETQVRSRLMSGLDHNQISDWSSNLFVTVAHHSCAVEVSVSDLRNDVRATGYWEDEYGALYIRGADTTIIVSP